MIHFARWKIILTLAICALGFIYTAPNAFSGASLRGWAESVPSWLPSRQINLGLDLQGGSYLLLRVESNAIVAERLEALVNSLRTELRTQNIGYTGLGHSGGTATFRVRDPAQAEQAAQIMRGLETSIAVTVAADGTVNGTFTEAALRDIQSNAVGQSIEVVRRRVDETGTNEPIIQRQGVDRILVQLPGLDDPARVRRLLGQTAQMTFQMVDDSIPITQALAGDLPASLELVPDAELGPDGRPVTYYVVRKRVSVSGENLIDAQPSFQNNQPVVSFRFDGVGARRFGETTQENVGRRFAIVLDGEVISAPVIRSAILGGSGIIEGGFTVQTATDLSLLLRAGALPAPLTTLEERTVGPGLGADSIEAGAIAAGIGILLVFVYMILTYGFFGILANLALIMNVVLLLAVMSMLQATLTLPGIAGIVLTIGMSVDANVLIFERIREEQRNGRSPISAIDAGFNRALTTIIDSNVTTLIAALLLFAFGSGPVKGFAVTLSIGLITSMFTAITVTRLMIITWLRRARPKLVPI